MADYITPKEYAELNGISYEAVKTRVRYNLIPHIKVGRSVMIDKNTPWNEIKKSGRPPKNAKSKVESRKSKVKIQITRAYYVAVVDNSGKEVVSDFTFLSKSEAEALGRKLKAEVEGRGNQ